MRAVRARLRHAFVEFTSRLPFYGAAVVCIDDKHVREIMPFVSKPLDPRVAQLSRLRCEAEVEQLCPESLDGTARKHCFEQRTPQLSVSCQHQVRQRLVKWKEERSRLIST